MFIQRFGRWLKRIIVFLALLSYRLYPLLLFSLVNPPTLTITTVRLNVFGDTRANKYVSVNCRCVLTYYYTLHSGWFSGHVHRLFLAVKMLKIWYFSFQRSSFRKNHVLHYFFPSPSLIVSCHVHVRWKKFGNHWSKAYWNHQQSKKKTRYKRRGWKDYSTLARIR